jgi:hypothetical protein
MRPLRACLKTRAAGRQGIFTAASSNFKSHISNFKFQSELASVLLEGELTGQVCQFSASVALRRSRMGCLSENWNWQTSFCSTF